ncbi:unnamed protein product [Rhizophagus irregularis]|nr:unnamed protein product [Rhizophagus irregularis]
MLNECLRLKKIPQEWKLADLYPIPKPKPWGCKLVNTRPIVLLETIRKLMVSILNRRCSKIFKENEILKGNQFAGLEGNSTFEPIRIIKEIIQDAIEDKKELWILALDMAKAYDRVNIHMLRKAMERLKLPVEFIILITELFLERKNQVFTAVGKTNPYEILTGIDQGEIISPLLWCIYYDPLLCQLQQNNLGYEISAEYTQDIYVEKIKESIIFPGKAYMDDTTIIAKNQTQLENMLAIADDFYTLNDIKINKEKSELLLKIEDKFFNYDIDIDIKFGTNIMKIKPKQPNESIRILGVWFNIKDDKNFVIQQVKAEVKKLCETIKKKKLTDKQMQYVFNALIIPTIEYRAQVTMLSEEECNNIASPFRRMFKNKLGMSIRMPTALIEYSQIYNIKNIAENQLQAKGSNFLIQINDKGLLRKIMNLRFKKLQDKLWLESSILTSLPEKADYKKLFKLKNSQKYKNWIIGNIELIRRANIQIDVNIETSNQFKVTGGVMPIRKIIETTFFDHIYKLKKKKIMFLEQLTGITNSCLINWVSLNLKQFRTKIYNSYKPHNWFKELQNIVTIDGKHLKNEYKTLSTSHMKGYKVDRLTQNNIPNGLTYKIMKMEVITLKLQNVWDVI